MRPGPPPKPLEQKRRMGNPGKRSLPVAGSLALVPPATAASIEALGPLGVELMEAGASAWLGRTDQLVLLRLIEDGWTERMQLRSRWIASDFSNDGIAKRLGKVEDDLTKWVQLAGLTPVDRSRLGVAEVKAQSTLEALRESRARRVGRPAG